MALALALALIEFTVESLECIEGRESIESMALALVLAIFKSKES